MIVSAVLLIFAIFALFAGAWPLTIVLLFLAGANLDD